MNAVNILLDKYRETCSLSSDSAVANDLGVTRQSVHQWRKGVAWPTEDHVIAMARTIHESEARWLPLIAADRAKNPDARRVWLQFAQAAAAVALIVSFGRLDVHHVSAASALFVVHNPGTLSIMSNGVALILVVAALLARHRKELPPHVSMAL